MGGGEEDGLQRAGLVERNAELAERARQKADDGVAGYPAEVEQHNQAETADVRRQLQGEGRRQAATHADAVAAAEKAEQEEGEEGNGIGHGVGKGRLKNGLRVVLL